MDESYLAILRMIEHGTISAEEGQMLLDALDAGSEPETQLAHEAHAAWGTMAEESEPRLSGPPAWAQGAWVYPLAGGVVLFKYFQSWHWSK